MIDSDVLHSALHLLEQQLHTTLDEPYWSSVSGGDINLCYQLKTAEAAFFFKFNRNQIAKEMFHCEALGLHALQEAQQFLVPKPLLQHSLESWHFLVLEFIPLTTHGSWVDFAKALAQMHSCVRSHYGSDCDNFIGTTDQINTWESNWAHFWWQHRLAPQLALCAANGHLKVASKQAELEQLNEEILADHQPQPSLLHGDLWSGNAAFGGSADGTRGQPCIFDPATYYGDRETDLALTELFGGFPNEFYRSYHAAAPLSSGYELRKEWYNLYHLLNHANLFGAHYPEACLQQIEKIKLGAVKSF